MKKYSHLHFTLFLFALFSLLAVPAVAEEQPGEILFKTMKCTKCHGTKAKQRGPSVITIASAYANTDELLLFFAGEKEAIVEPERAKTMKPRLRKIMKLNDADKKALASYLLGFKKMP